jgi:hypothetical protein
MEGDQGPWRVNLGPWRWIQGRGGWIKGYGGWIKGRRGWIDAHHVALERMLSAAPHTAQKLH